MPSFFHLPFIVSFIEHVERDGSLSRHIDYSEAQLDDLERACQVGLLKGTVDRSATPARFRFEGLRPAADQLWQVLQNTPVRDALLENYPTFDGEDPADLIAFSETWKKAKRESRLAAHPGHRDL